MKRRFLRILLVTLIFRVTYVHIHGVLLAPLQQQERHAAPNRPPRRPEEERSPCPRIEIHVFVYTRVNATRNLLSQLATADYSSSPLAIALVLHLDRPEAIHAPDPTVWDHHAQIKSIIAQFQWPHGPKRLDIKSRHVGLKASWISAWPQPGPDDIMIALEDDVEVSPLYFAWLVKVLQEYRLWKAAERDPRLLGVCLSPVTVDEITVYKRRQDRRWSVSEAIPREFEVYLHAIPCSWGAVYFGDQWRDFLSFYSIRGMPPFFDPAHATSHGDRRVWLPWSLSNTWVHSWKRFMFDFAYGRGAYMLYPSLDGNTGLARTLYLTGAHFDNAGDPLYQPVPLAREAGDLRLEAPWPAYDALPLLDMWCRTTNQTTLVEQGRQFLQAVSLLGPIYGALARRWASSATASPNAT